MEKVAIIGAGVSGAAVLKAYQTYLLKGLTCEIHLFDNSLLFGKGLPFQEESDVALNNSRTHQISFDYKKMSDFQNWVKQSNYPEIEYTPRHWYGQYQKEQVMKLIHQNNVIVHQHYISSIEYYPQNQSWSVMDDDGKYYSFDRIHLCCGILPQQDIFHLKSYAHYYHKPYPLNQLNPIINDDSTHSVTIIGMGLTAIDVIKYLTEDSKQLNKKITIFSRSGLFPSVRGEECTLDFYYLTDDNLKASLSKHKGSFPLHDLIQWVKDELALYEMTFDDIIEQFCVPGIKGLEIALQNSKKLGIIQAIALQISVLLTDGFYYMNKEEQAIYLERYHKYLILFRNPCPASSAEHLIYLIKNGILEVVDNIEEITFKKDTSTNFILKGKNQSYSTQAVVNATGMKLTPDSDLQESPLLQVLYNQQLIDIASVGGILINWETGNVLSPKYGEIDTLHAHGMLLEGLIYQNNSTVKIQKTAEKILERCYSI